MRAFFGFLGVVAILFFLTWFVFSKTLKPDVNKITTKISDVVGRGMEQAYFEGQRDYQNGIIRIEKCDSGYVWSSSPWDDGRTPSIQFFKE
jgi:hypothetical protein